MGGAATGGGALPHLVADPSRPMPGTPGKREYEYVAERVGTQQLKFVLHRMSQPATQTMSFTIKVTGS